MYSKQGERAKRILFFSLSGCITENANVKLTFMRLVEEEMEERKVITDGKLLCRGEGWETFYILPSRPSHINCGCSLKAATHSQQTGGRLSRQIELQWWAVQLIVVAWLTNGPSPAEPTPTPTPSADATRLSFDPTNVRCRLISCYTKRSL